MAVNKLAKTGRRSALALALAAMVLPGIAAAAEPGGEDRGGWRGRGGEAREAPGNIGASGWQRPIPNTMASTTPNMPTARPKPMPAARCSAATG